MKIVKFIPTILFFILLASKGNAQVMTAVQNQNGTYTNPVIAEDGPDPSVMLCDDGFFYLYSTGEKIWRSNTLTSWTYVGSVFGTERPTFVPGVNRYWAPDINKIGDKYVLYFALSKWGGIDSCGVGVAYGDKPSGPFTPVDGTGKLFLSYEVGVKNSIDPCYIEDNGKKYIIWGSFRGIYAIELSDDGLHLKDGAEKVQIAGTAYEGSYIYKRNGYYYYFGSTGTCCDGANSTYKTVFGRSTSLLGPYVTKSGERLLDNKYELLIQGNDKWAGTGHNAELTEDKNGDTWIIYHAYSKKNPELGRMVLLDKVQWKGDWPFVTNSEPSDRCAVPVF